jgi:methylated-DNA-[protein]-cysteine S-methyltransferase
MLSQKRLASPIGEILLVADDEGLTFVHFGMPDRGEPNLPPAATDVKKHPILDQAAAELKEYFAGTRRTFTVPLRPTGTPFQLSVWQELSRIPYGTHCSYGDVAGRIGKPKAVRAVGAANGQNPIGLIVPCHRVIGANGSLTGYGGGLAIKRWLLQHESSNQDLHAGEDGHAHGLLAVQRREDRKLRPRA